VEDAINKISIEKIKAKVKITPINFGNYTQQMNLILTSNEQLDLMADLSNTFTANVGKGALLPIDEYIEKDGKGIKDAIGEDFLKAGKVNGKQYGITTNRDLAQQPGIVMRKDLVDKYKIDTAKIQSLDDLDAVFKTVKEGEGGNFTPLVPSVIGTSFVAVYPVIDRLGEGFGVLLNLGDNLKVVDYYETPEYKALLTKLHNWYKQGYILKDASTNKQDQHSLMKANKGFGYISVLKPGIEGQESRAGGVEMVSSTLGKPLTTTSVVQTVQWVVPKNSVSAEKAVQFLNLMYTDKDIENLLAWGIEGKHYAVGAEGQIDFPSGVNAGNSGYNIGMGWMMGNQFLTYTWKGDSKNLWKDMDGFNKSAVKSKALGFTFDSTSVKTEVAAVTNVTNQYALGLETGTLDPEKVLPQFISKLKGAGIDKIVAEKQKQLDTWAQANNVK
jgi:putative aldouronate transport system substrate-binding protein